MTFKDIAFKNFKAHIKKYFSYFLCSSFSIMIFFIYSNLLFNDEITAKSKESNATILLFNIALTAVAIFSVFFINYAHTAFIKSRYREFGVYLTLGMTSNDIRKLITLENFIIIIASLFAGLISGVIFSRLFQMVVVKLLDLNNVVYSLNYKSFLLTIILFSLIFLCVIALSNLSTRKLEISDLLKQARKSENSKRGSLLPGLLGVIMIASSVFILYYIANNEKLVSNIPVILGYTAFSFTGVYLTISRFGITIVEFLRRRKEYYYNNLLTLTEINYKFKQNKKIIFVLSILSAMIIFFVASPFSLLFQAKHISGMSQINNLEYAEIYNINKISSDKLSNIINNSGAKVIENKTFEFIQLKYKASNDKYDVIKMKPVISQKTYNSFTHFDKLSVPKGQLLNLITAWEPGFHGMIPSKKVMLSSDSNSFEFIVNDSIHAVWLTGPTVFPSSSGIVLNDSDYARIRSIVTENQIGTVHIINFSDWEKTKDTVQNLTTAISQANNRNASIDIKTANLYKLTSRYAAYTGLKQGYSLFLFVTSVMGLLFFIAAGSVLYFKQYTEIGSAKVKFYKLYKLGISEKEISGIISKELKLTFFVPLILGSIMGYSFMYLITFLVGGGDVIKTFMINATVLVIIYFLFQVVFYLITKRKYVGEILESL